MVNQKSEGNEMNQGKQSAGARGGVFEIRVRGHLDESWSDWLDGLEVSLLDDDQMILTGPVSDQAALMGILNRLYGLNLALLSVSEVGTKK
jgi:hypothetical protein